MNQTVVSSHGRNQKQVHGWNFRNWAAALVAACLLIPAVSRGEIVTQIQYIQYIANLMGASASFTAQSSSGDYVAWAASKGMVPSGGWNAEAQMTKEILAETLVQLFNLNPKKYGGDLEKNLLREGIALPSEVTRESLLTTFDQAGFPAQRLEVFATITDILPPGLAKQGKIPPGWSVAPGLGGNPPPGRAKKAN